MDLLAMQIVYQGEKETLNFSLQLVQLLSHCTERRLYAC